MNKFYMIYVEGRGVPKQKHYTREGAIKECERLARLPENGDKDVCYLETIKYCCREHRPVKWYDTI